MTDDFEQIPAYAARLRHTGHLIIRIATFTAGGGIFAMLALDQPLPILVAIAAVALSAVLALGFTARRRFRMASRGWLLQLSEGSVTIADAAGQVELPWSAIEAVTPGAGNPIQSVHVSLGPDATEQAQVTGAAHRFLDRLTRDGMTIDRRATTMAIEDVYATLIRAQDGSRTP